MAAKPETAAWNSYYDQFGHEPSSISQFQTFTRSESTLRSLRFKEASKIFKLNKGRGRIPSSHSPSNKPPNAPTKKFPAKPPAIHSTNKHTPQPPNITPKTKKLKKESIKHKAPPKKSQARQIRSTLNNNPSDPSLHSILEILRRATLIKKQQQVLFKQQTENSQSVSMTEISNPASPVAPDVPYTEDERAERLIDMMGVGLTLETIIDEDIEEEELQSPPVLFREQKAWDFTASDIVFEQSLNYGLSLQLLHLGLTQGPLFPNSILKWKKLQFKENGPTPRTGHVAAFINDKMVIFGGYAKQMLTDHIFLVDTNGFDTNESLEVTAISSLEKVHKTYRVGHSGVALSHSLYLFGGWNDQQYINHGLLFYVDTLKLVDERNKDRILPAPRRDHTLCQMGSGLILFGGWSHDYDGNELWLLGSNWKWQQLNVFGTAPCPRRGHSANVIGSHMYIFGGLYGFSKYLNDLHVYNGDKSEWIQPELVGNTRPPSRAWHTSNTVGKQILFFGGTSGRLNFMNDCWVFDTLGYFWFQIECYDVCPLPRCSHSMVKIYQDEEFMNDAFANEHIQINKDGEIENAKNRKIRVALMMFGGLVAIEDSEDKEDKKENEEVNEKKIKKQKTNLKLRDLDDEKGLSDKEGNNENEDVKVKRVKQLRVQTDGLNEGDKLQINAKLPDDTVSSDSEQEEEMNHVNRVELSDDLYVLMLEI